jgi:probable phosphoglycerate mutase
VRRLYIVTHPEAEHHVSRQVGGWWDSALTGQGLRQATAIAARVQELVPVGAAVEVHSSDLIRTAQTARAIGELLGVQPILREGLREKSYGVAEGRPQAWLDARFVPPPPAGDRMNHVEGIEGAETKQQFAARVYAAVDEILARPCAHQVVVTHGFALTFVVAAWIGMPLESAGFVNFRSTSGGITVLEEDDFFANRSVMRLDDTAHLRSQ